MTYVPTWAGFIYLAVVLDVWSRRVVGWSIGEYMRTELVLSALNMALAQRRRERMIHHSDQDSKYASLAFGQRCQTMGVHPSMGSRRDAYDKAMAESFFASLECELVTMTYPRDRGNFIVSIIVIVDTIANEVGVRKVGSPDAYKCWKYVMEVDAGNREVL